MAKKEKVKENKTEEPVVEETTQEQEQINPSSFIPESVLNIASKMHSSFIKPLFGDMVGKSELEAVVKTLGNLLDRRENITYHLVSISRFFYKGINHMGSEFNIIPIDLRSYNDEDEGLYLVSEGPRTMNDFNRKCDITKFPLPRKGDPRIIVPLGIIVFFDDDDRLKFIANHRNMEIRQVMIDYLYGTMGNGAPGISRQIVNLSENQYYTPIDRTICQVPTVPEEDLAYNLPIHIKDQIKRLKDEKYDVFLIITKISYLNRRLPLGNMNDLNQNTVITFEVRGISKAERDKMEAILIPEANVFVFSNFQIGEKYLEEMAEIVDDNEDLRIDKYLFYRMYESFENQQKDKEEKNKEHRKEFNKSLFNLLLIAGAFATGTITATLGKGEIKKLIKMIKNFFTKNNRTTTTTNKAMEFVFRSLSKGDIMKILIGLGITIGVGVGGFFIYKYFKNKKSNNKKESTPMENNLKEEEIQEMVERIKPQVYDVFKNEVDINLDKQISEYLKDKKNSWLGKRIETVKELNKRAHIHSTIELSKAFWFKPTENSELMRIDLSTLPSLIPSIE